MFEEQPKIVKIPLGLPDDKGGTLWYEAEIGLTEEFLRSIAPALPNVNTLQEKLKLYENLLTEIKYFTKMKANSMGRIKMDSNSKYKGERLFAADEVPLIPPDAYADFKSKLKYLEELHGEKKG